MLNIYTHTKKVFSKEYFKSIAATLLNRNRGPRAVVGSLIRGLNELHVDYKLNPPYSSLKTEDLIHVVSGVQATKDLIEMKTQGKINRLTVGPNVTVSPNDENSLYFNPAIQKILLPSQWAKDYFIAIDTIFENKVSIWPSGVKDYGSPLNPVKERNFTCLIYVKNSPNDLLEKVKLELSNQNIPYTILVYGKFKQKHFFDELKKTACMIYLSPTESQGLALHEAWMQDIPTLVWSRGYWERDGIKIYSEKISAPYLTPECGLFFKDSCEFRDVLEYLHKNRNHFEPRRYSLSNFTDKRTADLFLREIQNNR